MLYFINHDNFSVFFLQKVSELPNRKVIRGGIDNRLMENFDKKIVTLIHSYTYVLMCV